ncbi:hypothetical protein AC578_3328 [Pseudocercospora eumusae]|uniref:Uncharacterized protein n=1 Tax=Pseudocercospora eumusae TaxID=321146 RepID=A0A139GVI5_9PEZI|nr:hypothetical protein AC578_3328 [Pseudocercospora eumusae]
MWTRAGYRIQLPAAALSSGIAFNPLLVQKLNSTQLAVDRDRLERDPISLYHELRVTTSYASCNGMYFTQPPLTLITTSMKVTGNQVHSCMGAEKLAELVAELRNCCQSPKTA